jgi:NAD(P)-dependent dehydrogenase (short-subunit alcohol dehydrogenase family)
MSVAVVTGAASGIGLALSTVYLQQGSHVVMVDINASQLMQKADELIDQFPNLVTPLICDVTQVLSVETLVLAVEKQFGTVDWIYNNAGIIGPLGAVWELNTEDVHKVMQVNLYGMLNMIRSFMPLLCKQQAPSHIINMASLYALCSGSQMAAYSMSKHAVLALSESLYYDLKQIKKPIHVSVVFPSFTDTALLANPNSDTRFHHSLNNLLSHSRPAVEVAQHIVKEVEQKQFYILPDKEVKGYCEERTKAIILQAEPHKNNIEKLIGSLLKRAR